MPRVVFLGTPDYAVPVLQACIDHYSVAYVVTQPDRQGGRGRREPQISPVKALAAGHGISVLQPERLSRDQQALSLLAGSDSDVFVLAAYGQILRARVLGLPRCGVIGVHASLLPRWRGASPVAAAIRAGDAQTGITLMLTEAGLDTGPIIAQRALLIEPKDTTGSLTARLGALGAALLVDTLPAWVAGQIEPVPQGDRASTYAPEIAKAEGRIDWHQSAEAIDRHIRAMTPWPGAFTSTARGLRLLVLSARLAESSAGSHPPGTVMRISEGLAVVAGDGAVLLETVQPAGKRPMPAEAFERGHPGLLGSVLS